MVAHNFKHLFTPLKVGNVTVKNRIFSTGHDTSLPTDGRVNDKLLAYQKARMEGGCGLIVLQVAGVHDNARYTSHILMATGDECIPGYRRMAEMAALRSDSMPDDPRDLEVHPNVWAGVGLVRGGAGTALVGSHAEVAHRMEEYRALGIEEFILSGYPHLEEAYAAGEGLLPELRRRGLLPELPERAPDPTSSFR